MQRALEHHREGGREESGKRTPPAWLVDPSACTRICDHIHILVYAYVSTYADRSACACDGMAYMPTWLHPTANMAQSKSHNSRRLRSTQIDCHATLMITWCCTPASVLCAGIHYHVWIRCAMSYRTRAYNNNHGCTNLPEAIPTRTQ